ncbi:hypothetical protein FSP39_008708 [Pinctada imbricata]|uniref:BHLH domain-containing protein n=1 Tax=Pinctada imbricata TaxID=66713 RepID=A0AA88Y885_PINIB|nr:hypothetical protein FSP39_008708 [Pinctada imbricata]
MPTHVEQEKKVRREIANSNERRRMQSINAGFQSLKNLIPHQEGEKLSKAAILQQTASYIHQLEKEKTRLLTHNNELSMQLKHLLGNNLDSYSPPTKRKKRDTESSDEGITADYDDVNEIKREMIELRCQLERERQLRMRLEGQTEAYDSQVYHIQKSPEPKQYASNMQAQMEKDKIIYMEQIKKEEEEEKLRNDSSSETESMSRRNLETIVEAIRHLEGDRLEEGNHHSSIVHSEESEKESSETEDNRSELSDHDSPLQYIQVMEDNRQSTLTELHPYQHSYPNLLHHTNLVQYYCRPNVIVQKS